MALNHWQKQNSDYAVPQAGSQGAGKASVVLGGKSGQATRHFWDDMRYSLSSNNPAYVTYFEDFLGNAGGTGVPSGWVNGAVGTGSAAYGALGAFGGTYTPTTGASANDYENFAYGANFKSENGWMFFTTKFTIPTLTTVTVEVGLTDALTETGGLVFSDHTASGVTAVADDAIVVAFEAAGDANYIVNAVKGGGTEQALDTGITPVASTFVTVDFAINSDGDARIYVDGTSVGTISDAITPTVLLTPFFVVKAIAAAARTVTVDWIGISSSR